MTTSKKPWGRPDVTPAPRTEFAQAIDPTRDRVGEQPWLGRYRKDSHGCYQWAMFGHSASEVRSAALAGLALPGAEGASPAPGQANFGALLRGF